MRPFILALLALLLAGCASAPQSASVVFPDVHGVAFDPADPSYVLVATHEGLYRGREDDWKGIGAMGDDLMGFALGPNGTLYSSGHPKGGGNLGFRRSDDGGATWRFVGAPNFDFHALSASPADPARIYGYHRGELWRSQDGGANWTARTELSVSSLAAHPSERDTVYAATTASVGRSNDGGDSWSELARLPAFGIALGDDGRLFAVGKDLVRASGNDGTTWSDIGPADAKGTFSSISVRGGSIVIASYEGAVWRSDDRGATWRQLH